MKVFQRETQFRTARRATVRDITDEVIEAVRESGVQDGIACVYSPHTTCCVRVNEFETGLPRGLRRRCSSRLVPRESYYAHDDWDRRTENICPEDMDIGNGHSHCMAMLLGTAGESIPVARRRAPARHLAARALPRARPRARPALARPGRRQQARAAASRSAATSRSIDEGLERVRLDLPDALARDSELLADRLERHRLVLAVRARSGARAPGAPARGARRAPGAASPRAG